LSDWFWPTAEVGQEEYRGAGKRAEAAGRAIRGIISATDPQRPFAFLPQIHGKGSTMDVDDSIRSRFGVVACLRDMGSH